MKMNKYLSTLLLAIFGIILTGCAPDSQGPLTASGFVEGETYHLVAILGGKVELVNVSLGDRVVDNQVLIQFDTDELDARLAQAQAGMDGANSALSGLEERPAADQVAEARTNLDLAQVDLELAMTSLELLKATYEPFDPPDADLHRAEYTVEIARSEVELAEALLNQARDGPHQAEWDIAQAKIEESKAQIDLIERRLEDLMVLAPVNGLVSQLLVNSGEIVPPGTTVVHVLDPSDLRLTLYIPVDQVAEVEIGNRVTLTTDSYPGEVFDGAVVKVADKAQFTPTLVLTAEEQVKLVFEVEVRVVSGLDKLKPGMPVDGEFVSN